MADVPLVPVSAPPLTMGVPPPKKDQEDLNIDVYKRVFRKCLQAADDLAEAEMHSPSDSLRVDIAKAIFDRFYNDQTALKAGQIQAKAMIDGMTSLLEGRR